MQRGKPVSFAAWPCSLPAVLYWWRSYRDAREREHARHPAPRSRRSRGRLAAPSVAAASKTATTDVTTALPTKNARRPGGSVSVPTPLAAGTERAVPAASPPTGESGRAAAGSCRGARRLAGRARAAAERRGLGESPVCAFSRRLNGLRSSRERPLRASSPSAITPNERIRPYPWGSCKKFCCESCR